MADYNGIWIKNIYYMLSYAFQELKRGNFESVAAEKFRGMEDLFAEILARGITLQLKRGLRLEYVPFNETLPSLRGKVDVHGTILNRLAHRRELACSFDELSQNNLYNRILKATALSFLNCPTVDAARKSKLRNLLYFFSDVGTIDLTAVVWSRLSFRRNDQICRMLITICRLAVQGRLLTTENGGHLSPSFSDESIERLYEKFILEYYRRHYPNLKAAPVQINWDLPDEENADLQFLPKMKTDIFLSGENKSLIIDAKFYSKTLIASQYGDRQKLRSAHLYQIFAYVKNAAAQYGGEVAGLLLYAKTEELLTPDFSYQINGHQIGANTLDLNRPFKEIQESLNKIVCDYFGIPPAAG